MSVLPAVVQAEYRGEYSIHVVFNDGVENTIDFAPLLDKSVFEPLKDKDYFNVPSSTQERSVGQTAPTSHQKHFMRSRD